MSLSYSFSDQGDYTDENRSTEPLDSDNDNDTDIDDDNELYFNSHIVPNTTIKKKNCTDKDIPEDLRPLYNTVKK